MPGNKIKICFEVGEIQYGALDYFRSDLKRNFNYPILFITDMLYYECKRYWKWMN